MIIVPVTILDNFLDNPDTIRDWGLSLPYTSSSEGRWPGKRTECLSIIHPPLFDYINRKVLSLFFENPLEYKCGLAFQLMEDYPGTGWVHQDGSLFTYIIYLSPENEINCGSSLYELKPNKIHNINSSKDLSDNNLRNEHYKMKIFPPTTQKIKSQIEDTNYNKVLDVKDKYNRLLCFSSELLHSANNFSNNISPRLTLVGFVNKIGACNPPIIRSKQSIM